MCDKGRGFRRAGAAAQATGGRKMGNQRWHAAKQQEAGLQQLGELVCIKERVFRTQRKIVHP